MRKRTVWLSGAVTPASGQRRKSRKGLSTLDSGSPLSSLASSVLMSSAYSFSPITYSEKMAKIGASMRVVAWRLKA